MSTFAATVRHNWQPGSEARGFLVFKKIVTWLVIAFVVYFVLKEPTRAGDVVRNTATALNHAGHQVLNFFDSIV